MCKFCDAKDGYGYPDYLKKDKEISVYIVQSKYGNRIEIAENQHGAVLGEFEINNCPICGRRLYPRMEKCDVIHKSVSKDKCKVIRIY